MALWWAGVWACAGSTLPGRTEYRRLLFSNVAEAGPLREEVTPRNMERSQDVTPATIQSSRDILSLLTDDLDPAKSLVPEEPRVSADSIAEPHISSSPAEPAAKKSKKVPPWKKCWKISSIIHCKWNDFHLLRLEKKMETVKIFLDFDLFNLVHLKSHCPLLLFKGVLLTLSFFSLTLQW